MHQSVSTGTWQHHRSAASPSIRAQRKTAPGTVSRVPFFPCPASADHRSAERGYLQAGSPSPAVGTSVFVVFTPMAQVKPPGICVCVTVAYQEPVPGRMVGEFTPVELLNCAPL